MYNRIHESVYSIASQQGEAMSKLRKFLEPVCQFFGEFRHWTWLDSLSVLCAAGAPVVMVLMLCSKQDASKILSVGGIIFSLGGTCWLATGVLLSKSEQAQMRDGDITATGKALAVASSRVALAIIILVVNIVLQVVAAFVA